MMMRMKEGRDVLKRRCLLAYKTVDGGVKDAGALDLDIAMFALCIPSDQCGSLDRVLSMLYFSYPREAAHTWINGSFGNRPHTCD